MKFSFIQLCIVACLSGIYFDANAADNDRIAKIETTHDSVSIVFNKKISQDKTFLLVPETGKLIKPKFISRYRADFSVSGIKNQPCYKIKIKSKFWSYTDKSSDNIWCFRNIEREKYLKVREEYSYHLRERDSAVQNLENLKQILAGENALTENFSESCRFPKPITTPKPASFCADSQRMTEKRNQCYAPLIKAACVYTINDLVKMNRNEIEELAVPLACVEIANSLVDKKANTDDLLVAGGQSIFMSKTGIKGFFGNLISFTFAAARHDSCVANLNQQCFPEPPTPTDCAEWNAHKSSKTNLSERIAAFENSVSKEESNLLEISRSNPHFKLNAPN